MWRAWWRREGPRVWQSASRAGTPGRCWLNPNAAEASELPGLPRASAAQARGAAATMPGIAQIVISMGAAGALLVDAGHGWLATPPAIQQHNPIGAGDALVAGLV